MPLESISVAEQHRRYAPDDPHIQESLTAAAGAPALEYTMRRCSECALEYCVPMIAPNSGWYQLAYATLPLYPSGRWEFERVLQAIEPGGRVFELGCGNGAFLKLCQQRGFSARGADFSESAVRECRAAGLEAEVLELTDGTWAHAGWKAGQIAAFHVLEHLDRPEALFSLARATSEPDATLWIAVPSFRRPSRLLREGDFLDQPPHHLTRWTEWALKAAGTRQGWKLESIEHEPIAARTAVWWIARRGSSGVASGARLWARYPQAWFKWRKEFPEMTGFTMLARFRREA